MEEKPNFEDGRFFIAMEGQKVFCLYSDGPGLEKTAIGILHVQPPFIQIERRPNGEDIILNLRQVLKLRTYSEVKQ